MSPPVLLINGLAAIGIGLISCFYGYRMFRVVMTLLGFLFGFAAGTSLVSADQGLSQLAAGLIGGLVGGIIFYLLFIIGVVVVGAIFGALLVVGVLIVLRVEHGGLLLAGLLGGGLGGGLLAFWLEKLMIVISTATIGAAAIIYGTSLVLPGVIQMNEQGIPYTTSPLTPVIWIVLALVGLLVQIRVYGNELRR